MLQYEKLGSYSWAYVTKTVFTFWKYLRGVKDQSMIDFFLFYFIFYKTPENRAKKGKYYSTLELHQKMYFHWDEAALMLLCKYCWEFV